MTIPQKGKRLTVDPGRRHDAIHYLTRIFGGQLTPRGPKRFHSSTHGSDLSYVRFLGVDKRSGRVRQTARRRIDSIEGLLQQMERYTDRWDIYACPDGYWRAGYADGRRLPGWRYTTSQLRWLNDVVIDLDRKNLARYPQMMATWERDPQAVLDLIHDRLAAAGVTNYMIVQTNPEYGLQVHVLLQPTRANYSWGDRGANSTATYREASAALYRLLERFGADRGAWKRPTQVFRIPGVARPAYDHYRVELIVDHQVGERVGLYELFRRLFAMGLVETPEMQRLRRMQEARAKTKTQRVRHLPWAGQRTLLSQRIAAGEVRGVADGRKQLAYKLALALFAEARLHHPDREDMAAVRAHVEHLVRLWNRANERPLPDAVIASAVTSAGEGCGRVTSLLWNHVCEALGVRVAHPYAKWTKLAKERPERVRDHQEEIEEDFVHWLQATGGQWEGVQGDLPGLLQEARGLAKPPALRTVQRALSTLSERGVVSLETRRGRGGSTRVELLAAAEAPSPESLNLSCANAGGAIAPNGDPLGEMEGGWKYARGREEGAGDLVARCRLLFGSQIVVDCEGDGQQDGAGGSSAREIRPEQESYRERVFRELATATESALVVVLSRVRRPERMAMLLQAAGELGLEGRSRRLAGVLARLRERLEEAEGEAWMELRAGRIAASALEWLSTLQEEPGDLQGLLAMASEWGLERFPGHTVALSRVRRRLRRLMVARAEAEVATAGSV